MNNEIKDFLQNGNILNIIKNIPEALIISNFDHNILLVNNALLKLYGDKEENIIGIKLNKIISDTSSINCPVCNISGIRILSDEIISHQASFKNLKEKEILIRICHTIDRQNNIYISTLSPLSSLICLDQAQIDFVSTVSHELRTPMTSIKGFADTLLSAGDKLSKEQQIRFISIIKSQADRLTRLVENLLTVSRLESKTHKSNFRSLNLQFYLERIIFSIKNKFPKHKFVTILAENLPTVWADQDKLEQVLTNLLDNAAKYSSENTIITIKASLTPDNANKIEIKIIDQGIGIAEEHIPKIFNKFSRIDNPLTRQVQGTGLGLYITKALVESMNGTISLVSNKKGSTFIVSLLVATPEIQAKQSLVEV